MASITATAQFQIEIESVHEFLERFKVINASILQNEDTTDAARAATLIKYLPVQIITDIQRRIKPTTLTAAKFKDIETCLITQFEVKKSIIGASVKFLSRKQLQSESIQAYAQTLNELASHCEYSDCCRDRLLRDIFVSGLRSAKLVSALLQEK